MDIRVVILLVCLGIAQAKVLNLSCRQIQQFVDGHNNRRLRLAKGHVSSQPPASEMNFMVWDDELAAKAAKWASRDGDGHNPDKTIGSGRFTTGENLYWYSTTDHSYKLNPDAALESWFNEYKDFPFRPLEWNDFSDDGPDIGHYTQMAWSDSTYVGCAISQSVNHKGWNSFLVVCNYGPQGNLIGRAPYKPGRASNELICSIDDCSQPYGDRC